MLKNIKNKMYQYINKYGLNSNNTIKISQQLDLEINKYYKNSSMNYFYTQSKNGLFEYYNKYNNLPNSISWNHYAKENDLLSSESIKYISGQNFEKWCQLVIDEKNVIQEKDTDSY